MRYSINQTSEPGYKPVSLDECKGFLEISEDDTRHDSKINNLLLGAINRAENYTKQLFSQRTITINYDYFEEYIYLPVNPVTSIVSIQYYDADNALQTLNTSEYEYDLYDQPPFIRFKSLPTTYDRINSVLINIVAGYPSNNSPVSADKVPDAIKEAIKFMVYQSFLNRGEETEENITAFKNLLYNYRQIEL